VNAAEEVVLRRKLRRKEMVTFFEKLAPTVIRLPAPARTRPERRVTAQRQHGKCRKTGFACRLTN